MRLRFPSVTIKKYNKKSRGQEGVFLIITIFINIVTINIWIQDRRASLNADWLAMVEAPLFSFPPPLFPSKITV